MKAIESGAQALPHPLRRRLTDGEQALAASVFGTALDAAAVTIRREKFWLLHPRRVTMAPNGHIWCHPEGDNWCADYAAAALGLKAHFVHEMVHVWQHQQGINLFLRRLPFARYRYALLPGKPFQRYGIEQQACIVADAFLLREGALLAEKPPLAAYSSVIPFGRWH